MRPAAIVASTAIGVIAGGIVLMGAFSVYAEESISAHAKEKTAKAAAALKEETTSALRKAAETKEEYQMRLKAEIEAMKPRIEELKKKSANMAKEARGKAQEQMAVLEKKRMEVESKLAGLGEKGEKAWDEMKAGMDAAVDDLKKSYDAAKEKFKHNEP